MSRHVPGCHHCRRTKVALLLFVVILAGIEGWARWSGVANVPHYEANAVVGYLPAPSQSGVFLRRYAWQFNALSMGAGEFAPTAATDVLLLGDTIVHGGVHTHQPQRLGPQLQAVSGDAVWPVSATSWRLPNALAWLEQHPGVVQQVDELVFILNNGDFARASSWSCALTHPRAAPQLASLYWLRLKFMDWQACNETPPALAVPASDWRIDLGRLLASPPLQGRQVSFFLYPLQAELATDSQRRKRLEERSAQIVQASPVPVQVFSIAADPRWNKTLYRPDGIHPTPAGIAVLAAIIAAPAATARLHPAPGPGPSNPGTADP